MLINMKKLIPNIEKWNKVSWYIKKLIDVTGAVSWWNSDFQNKKIVIDWMQTPERAYRHASLRINNRLQALSECETNLKKKSIEVKKKLRQIERLKQEMPLDYDLDIEEFLR